MASTTGSGWAGASAVGIIMRERLIEYTARQVVAANLFAVEDLPEGFGAMRIGRWPTVTAGAVTEGTDMTPGAVTPTAAAHTPSIVGLAIEVSDLLRGNAPFRGMDPFVRQGGFALAEKLEDDVCALFGALNGGTSIGTSGSDLTFADNLTALVTVKAAQVPGPYFWILHPRQWGDYWASVGAAATGGSFVGQKVNAVDKWAMGSNGNGYVTDIAGVPGYEQPRCPLVNTNADRGGVLAAMDAITIVRRWTMNVEIGRNEYGPATKIGITSAYSVTESADNFGVPVETDA